MNSLPGKEFFGIIIFLMIGVIGSVRAQSYYFRHYQVEQGLSNNTVFCVAQDKRGFVWLGTKDGLNRFDGYNFKVFRNIATDSSSLGDSFVRSIFIDAYDTLYAGTRNGLYRYDPRLEKFTILVKGIEEVRDIKKDQHGNIWFIEGQNLKVWLGSQQKLKRFKITPNFAATSIGFDKQGQAWVATASGALMHYREKTDDFKAYQILTPSNEPLQSWIEKIYITRNNNILVGTANRGAFLFNLKDYSLDPLSDKKHPAAGVYVRDFAEPNDSTFWVATEVGIFIYNHQSHHIQQVKKEFQNPFTISDNAVYSLCMDKESGIWVGTYFGGLNYYPKPKAIFQKWLPGEGNTRLSGQVVREICRDDDKNLWVGTEDGGLNRINAATGEIEKFLADGKPGSICYPNIHGLLIHNKQLWIGTFEHGLDVMDLASGKIVAHYPKGAFQSMKSTFFVVLYKTINGEILAGTRRGLYRFENNLQQFVAIDKIPDHCFVHTITEDADGGLWVGTLGNGLYHLPANGQPVQQFTNAGAKKESLPSNAITTLFIDSKNSLWIGTEGGGLVKTTSQGKNFQRYGPQEGFPGNTIFKILEDNQQRLWVTTSIGLMMLDYIKDSTKVYTTSNGLLSNQFNYNSGYKDDEGNLYFGSAKGMISFNPANFQETVINPPVYITGLSVGGNPIQVNENTKTLNQSLLYNPVIQLKHHQSTFAIDFAALHFTAPDITGYKYIMEGLDNKWLMINQDRRIHFTNLPPGSYTFKVKASAGGGKWGTDVASVSILIHPPFYASTWAYTLYVLMVLGISYWLFKLYHQSMSLKAARKLESMEHEKETEMFQAKIEFFTNVAHEIKTPLTLIKAPMEQIINKGIHNYEFEYEINLINRNTNRLLELTNQLLDFRKAETSAYQLSLQKINMNEILEDHYQRFLPLAQQRNIDLQLMLPPTRLFVLADNDALQKMIDNLLHNALNYCSKYVSIILERSVNKRNHISIKFINDGPAIPPALREKIFQPFFRIESSKNKSGTGIGLALAQSLTHLQNGTLELIESNDGQTFFLLQMPMVSKPNLKN
jgi:signal transduction histidine kinase/ligand-binding sensor domain-containing protein